MADTALVATGEMTWMDLGTKDLETAKRFYGELFGWTADVAPEPEFGGYTLFSIEGKAVGGAMDTSGQPQPPMWLPYISVEDARATVERVREAGGQAIVDAMQVGTHGTMAVVLDPTGAAFGLWQPDQMQGWEAYRRTGAVCWQELHTGDEEAAKRFYGHVFGWTLESQPFGDQVYTTISKDGREAFAGLAGLMGAPQSHWLTYLAVDDCDATAAKVTELGGSVMVGPEDIPTVGRFAVATDPGGAVFAVLQPLPQQQPQG